VPVSQHRRRNRHYRRSSANCGDSRGYASGDRTHPEHGTLACRVAGFGSDCDAGSGTARRGAIKKTIDVQQDTRHTTTDITRVEDTRDTAATEADKSRFASDLDRLKGDLSSLKKLEQDRLSNQQEAEASLQKAQNAYDVIEDQRSALVKTLHTAQDVGNK
jgi:hypothetical protein